jgi:hypothetical protein
MAKGIKNDNDKIDINHIKVGNIINEIDINDNNKNKNKVDIKIINAKANMTIVM